MFFFLLASPKTKFKHPSNLKFSLNFSTKLSKKVIEILKFQDRLNPFNILFFKDYFSNLNNEINIFDLYQLRKKTPNKYKFSLNVEISIQPRFEIFCKLVP